MITAPDLFMFRLQI